MHERRILKVELWEVDRSYESVVDIRYAIRIGPRWPQLGMSVSDRGVAADLLAQLANFLVTCAPTAIEPLEPPPFPGGEPQLPLGEAKDDDVG